MKLLIGGESVDIGGRPFCLEICGFKNRNEVVRAATKHGLIEHPMRLDDVVEFFKEKNREGNK